MCYNNCEVISLKKLNVIVIFNKDMTKTLMCKRAKDPYKGKYNFVGGKIEKENDGLNEAYRELYEETNISKQDIDLTFFMKLTYVKWNWELEVYYGILDHPVKLVEEVNKLKWLPMTENFFDTNKYAGEGNVGHFIEEIKLDIAKDNVKI